MWNGDPMQALRAPCPETTRLRTEVTTYFCVNIIAIFSNSILIISLMLLFMLLFMLLNLHQAFWRPKH